MKTPEQIVLPSFLRKTLKAYALKAEIRRIGCTLQRKGRSRHWLLIVTREQMHDICEFINNSDEESWYWLAKVLGEKLNRWTEKELLELVRTNSQITVNELVGKTDCTVADARRIIDIVEFESE